jgi:hypothetical protein
MPLRIQLAWLLILALPVASIAWTVTHEEVFREPREWCEDRSRSARHFALRKFFYLFTCEYCFSHYVAALVLVITGFTMLYPAGDWRGYMVAWFGLVWVANVYINIYARLRLEIKRERVEIKGAEAEVQAKKREQAKGPRIVPRD